MGAMDVGTGHNGAHGQEAMAGAPDALDEKRGREEWVGGW